MIFQVRELLTSNFCMTYVLKFHEMTLTGVDFWQYNIDIWHKSDYVQDILEWLTTHTHEKDSLNHIKAQKK